MVAEVRTVLKDFNPRLLHRDLTASALPFDSLDLAGFVRKNRYVWEPAPADRVIVDDKVANTQDLAVPGELRFEFTRALTGAEDTALDTALTNHDATQRTQRQVRRQRDFDQLDTLQADWPNWDTFSAAEKDAFLKKLARFVIRTARQTATF